MSLQELLKNIEKCRACEQSLPHAPRPTVKVHDTAKILLIGQAPGLQVHETGLPWNDRSGDRLRQWLSLSREAFYNPSHIAMMPMGFCYPGKDKHGGDKPPLPKCAPLWHNLIRGYLPHIKLTLLVGWYAQRHYLQTNTKTTMTETVQSYHEYLPHFFPLPHPSWRNTAWLRKNPWFEIKVLPILKQYIAEILLL